MIMPSKLPFARMWKERQSEAVALAALALVGASAAAGSAWSSPGFGEISSARESRTAPVPPPLLIRNVAPGDALQANEKIPLASGPNPAAKPFSEANLTSETRASALDCLASAVYYEAGQENADGQRGVAQVVLNRVRHPAFPSSVCRVVYQGSTRSTGCQFTFTCDGSLARRPDSAGWARARKVAQAALGGAVFGPVGLATHYHADYVLPYWAASLAKNAVIGAHLFYRWSGGWGRPAAFTQRYARREPSSSALKATALEAFASRPAKLSLTAELAAESLGAEVEKAPGGRVAVRFRIEEARKAVEEAPRKPYVEKMAASDNLRWTLSGSSPAIDQKPLGRSPEASDAAPTGD